jgi:hypothetical protein
LSKQLKADPEVAKHFKPGELEKLCSLDFHFKEVNNRFKKLGLDARAPGAREQKRHGHRALLPQHRRHRLEGAHHFHRGI